MCGDLNVGFTKLTRIHIEVGIADFDEILENIRPVFFLSAMVDVEGVKTTLKAGAVEHILLNISEIIEDIVFG